MGANGAKVFVVDFFHGETAGGFGGLFVIGGCVYMMLSMSHEPLPQQQYLRIIQNGSKVVYGSLSDFCCQNIVPRIRKSIASYAF